MRNKEFEKAIKILQLELAEFNAKDGKSIYDYEDIIGNVYSCYVTLDNALKNRY